LERFKKCFAEFIGTAVLVTVGCGTAMMLGTASAGSSGYILTALAFGLAYIAMYYALGQSSGCHLNPAVSVGVLVAGEMSAGDFFGYIIAQTAGAFAGTELLSLIWNMGDYTDLAGNYFANTTARAGTAASFIVELFLTIAFVLAAVGVILKRDYRGAGGVAIGLALSGVNIFGIAFTNASVNPARSLASALTSLIGGNSGPISDIWVFILAPILGGALAAGIYRATEHRSI
jgi:aquaporin Z